jgi:hypothetical protein
MISRNPEAWSDLSEKRRSSMKKIVFRCLLLAMSLTLLAGCATLSDVERSKLDGTGTVRDYAVTPDQAWEIARKVFRWEGADAIEEHKTEGYMLTSSSLNLLTAGTVMGAWIEPLGKEQTRVTVITKRRIAIDTFTQLTETTFHNRFAQGVELVKAGRPLPLTRPD